MPARDGAGFVGFVWVGLGCLCLTACFVALLLACLLGLLCAWLSGRRVYMYTTCAYRRVFQLNGKNTREKGEDRFTTRQS